LGQATPHSCLLTNARNLRLVTFLRSRIRHCSPPGTFQDGVGQSGCKEATTCDAGEREAASPTASSDREVGEKIARHWDVLLFVLFSLSPAPFPPASLHIFARSPRPRHLHPPVSITRALCLIYAPRIITRRSVPPVKSGQSIRTLRGSSHANPLPSACPATTSAWLPQQWPMRCAPFALRERFLTAHSRRAVRRFSCAHWVLVKRLRRRPLPTVCVRLASLARRTATNKAGRHASPSPSAQLGSKAWPAQK
jgi:hypothetical protein